MDNCLPNAFFVSRGGLFLTVPKGCGLQMADTLQVAADGQMRALRRAGKHVELVPVRLAPVPVDVVPAVRRLDGAKLAVGEFTVRGVVAAYEVNVEAVEKI